MFSGFGGLDIAATQHFGGDVLWHVENDKNCSTVLDANFPDIPNHGDITAVNWREVEPVDIIIGGFPCQDLSGAGKRAGLKPGTRSGLWEHFAYAIAELRPKLVVIENVRGLLSAKTADSREVVRYGPRGGRKVELTRRAAARVLWDLADLGFDAEWGVVSASDAGAPHIRQRVFIVASHPGRGQQSRPAQPLRRLPVTPERPYPWSEKGNGPVTLLPTPAVNDMGAGKTVEAWDAWTDKMRAKHRNGNSHGKSLHIEAQRHSDFGPYSAAIERWSQVLGRPAPPPTELGKDGRPRLSPRVVEWLMGLPDGWVTGTGISPNAQLKALGNGCVPQQVLYALNQLAN